MRVSVLVLDGVFDSGLAVVLDTLATANDLSEGRKSNRYHVTLCGLRKTATTAHGLRVSLSPVRSRVRTDVVIVRTTKESIEQIASGVGYGDGVTLRTLLRRKTGRGIRELRATEG